MPNLHISLWPGIKSWPLKTTLYNYDLQGHTVGKKCCNSVLFVVFILLGCSTST